MATLDRWLGENVETDENRDRVRSAASGLGDLRACELEDLHRGQRRARGALGLLGLPRTHLRQVRSRDGHRPTPSSRKSRIHIMYKDDSVLLSQASVLPRSKK